MQFSRKLLFIPLSYTEENKGYVFHATISLILTPSSLLCFRGNKKGKKEGGRIHQPEDRRPARYHGE